MSSRLPQDDAQDTFAVESARPLPTGDALHDAIIVLEHERDTTTFTIDGIEAAGTSGYVVPLKWTPHMVQNYLRVVDAVGSSLAIEPPPSLEQGFGTRSYQVYKVEESGQTTRLGEIERSYGSTVTLNTARASVAPGELVGVTKLKKGSDRFSITTSTSTETQVRIRRSTPVAGQGSVPGGPYTHHAQTIQDSP